LEAGGLLFGAQTASDATSAARATFTALAAHLRLAYVASLGQLRLGPVLSGGVVWLDFNGAQGSAGHFPDPQPVPARGGGRTLGWAGRERVELGVCGEALVPTFRPRFVVLEPNSEPSQLIHQSSKVVGRLMLGVGFQFL